MNRSAGTTSKGSRTRGSDSPRRGTPCSATDGGETQCSAADGSQTPPCCGPADGSKPLQSEVFCADPDARQQVTEAALPDGFDGRLSLKDPQSLNLEDADGVLQRLEALLCWATAQQVQVIARIQDVLEVGLPAEQRGTTRSLSLAAAEVGTVLNVPHMTAMGRVFEAGELCRAYPQTLSHLSAGRITYRHAQEVLDHTRSVEEKDRAQFESELLALAEDSTVAKFRIKARRLRERRHPETIPQRHRDAFGKRRVSVEGLPDGMACVSAFLAAERGQAIFASLSGAARAAKKAGDERNTDQLRSDIFASVFLDGCADPSGVADRAQIDGEVPAAPQTCAPDTDRSSEAGDGAPAVSPRSPSGRRSARTVTRTRSRRKNLKTEIMVLIQADTLVGLNETPAELNGYGPLSPETGRRMFQEAANWTPLLQDPATGEILHVGRRRRIPAGLKRWLQARDGTCRFPGCSVSVLNSEIDHTRPWAWGGETSHANLEHLCAKHHRLKTLGYWKAVQTEPGVIEWTSPGGLRRRTGPMLDYGRGSHRARDTGQTLEPGEKLVPVLPDRGRTGRLPSIPTGWGTGDPPPFQVQADKDLPDPPPF
ncbi:MAG: DUF222 domain-containing protein [Arthrobacter sp.]